MVATSRSKSRADAAAQKRTTRSSAAAAAPGARQIHDIVNANSPSAAPTNGTSKAALPTTKQETETPAKKAQFQTKPEESSNQPITSGDVAARRKSDDEGQLFCSCEGRDDGSPMIKCDGDCDTWYHLRCIDVSEDDAGEIDAYFCSNCETKLGVKTISKCAPFLILFLISVSFRYYFLLAHVLQQSVMYRLIHSSYHDPTAPSLESSFLMTASPTPSHPLLCGVECHLCEERIRPPSPLKRDAFNDGRCFVDPLRPLGDGQRLIRH